LTEIRELIVWLEILRDHAITTSVKTEVTRRAWYLKHLRLLSFDMSEMALSSILPASLIVVAPGPDKMILREVEMGAM